jgi:DNA-binding CsgD family transcriptional regulator
MADAMTMPPPMSGRQREVLLQLAAGKTNEQIGKDMFLSESTVKTHIRRLFQAWGVTSRGRLVEAARDAGLLPCGTCRRPAEDRAALAEFITEAKRVLAELSKTVCDRTAAPGGDGRG